MRCVCFGASFPIAWRSTLCVSRRRVLIPPVTPLTHGGSRTSTSTSTGAHSTRAAGRGFALRDSERGLYDRGVTPEARALIAEAEAQYSASAAHLSSPSSPTASTTAPITHFDADGTCVTTIAAPFGETYVPSHAERFAHRRHIGELSRPRALKAAAAHGGDGGDGAFGAFGDGDPCAARSLRAGRQLRELLASPMPPREKADAVAQRLREAREARLALAPRDVEAAMVLWAHCETKKRLEEMRALYMYARESRVAPTPLSMEALMTALCAEPAPDAMGFHLANQIFLDADRFVVLPTRTTYAAFFRICAAHNAMSFAVARFRDAVAHLNISVDAAMATAMLRGLSQNGLTEEAVALLARLEHIPMDAQLLNASLEVLLLSAQPQSCFAAFRAAVLPGEVRPTAETYTLLLLTCERTGLWGETTAILADMQRRRVRGDGRTLNLLLKGLMKQRLHGYARQLYGTMVTKQVEVWPSLAARMTNTQEKATAKGQHEREKV